MKPHWEIPATEADACLAATEWCGDSRNTSAAAATHPFPDRRRAILMTRVNIIRLGPVLQITEGWSVELPKKRCTIAQLTHQLCDTTTVCAASYRQGPFADVCSVMANWGANPAYSPSAMGRTLLLAAMLRTIPVCMQRGGRITVASAGRLAVWLIRGAGLCACQNYGPLYGCDQCGLAGGDLLGLRAREPSGG